MLRIYTKMKKILRNIIALGLALFFFLAGSGMNIIKYCCNICSEHGIEEVAANSCNAFHDHEESCCSADVHEYEVQDDMTCTITTHHPEGCHLLRLNVETPTLALDKLIEKITTSVIVILFTQLHDILLAGNFVSTQITDFSPPEFVFQSGRQILTAKSVLII